MRNIITATMAIVLMASTTQLHALTRWVEVTCIQKEAKIYANGDHVGTGTAKFLVTKNQDCKVSITLPGYVTETYFFYYREGKPVEKSKTFDLKPDPSWEASMKTELANVEIGLNSSKAESDAWKTIKRIVNAYFEIPEQVDDHGGYMRTAWATVSYQHVTIRTRVIVRSVSSDPLEYRVKIFSEISDTPGTNATQDDKFKPWDRMLRKYEQLIPELQSRLK